MQYYTKWSDEEDSRLAPVSSRELETLMEAAVRTKQSLQIWVKKGTAPPEFSQWYHFSADEKRWMWRGPGVTY